ncbi:ferroxidase fet3 [Ceratocystis pirilliformis]|uniref:Ferroxidase fet3 n=1 Tax=Ceratocystis pirilliformis TaxID=259994 RepID=A0ABR3YV88_9PEZI
MVGLSHLCRSLMLPLLFSCNAALAKTVEYNFTLSWVDANPDGMFTRKVVGINGQWPLPVIEVDMGDQLVVHMKNELDRGSSIHFHGMFQNGTSHMDGPSMITQCPVPPGSSLTYNFTVEQPGTYWYHCHTDFCYPDGYRQALLVHDPNAFYADEIEAEIPITLSDWYHELQDKLSEEFMSVYNPTGAEPVPNSFLFNDTQNVKIPVLPNKTYLLRIINIGAFVSQYFYIEDHDFEIVEIDGVYTEPQTASMLVISAAQRYSVLLRTKNSTNANYGIVTVADSDLLDLIPSDLQLNQTNWLLYNESAPTNEVPMTVEESNELVPFDDFELVPYDKVELFPEPDVNVELTVSMNNLITGENYAFFNNITFNMPKVPSLYTALNSGNLSTNPTIYGSSTQPVVLKRNEVVQITLNNADPGSHPFHLHGHNFQVIDRAPPYGPEYNSFKDGDPVPFDPSNHAEFPKYPARRDVVTVPPQGYVVLRFIADNPGVWIFHCHIDWHLSSGLAMIFIEAPEDLQRDLVIPEDHIEVCKAGNVPFTGNAAANTEDYLDLAGENLQPGWLPAGFTTRGIIALVFSCVSAFLGMASLAIYGMSGVQTQAQKPVQVVVREEDKNKATDDHSN